MAPDYPAVPPRPPLRGTPRAVGPAGDTILPPSAVAPRTDSSPRCPSRNCPCATARPALV